MATNGQFNVYTLFWASFLDENRTETRYNGLIPPGLGRGKKRDSLS